MAALIRTTGAARFWTEREFGGPVRENESNVTATTTAAQLVKNNPDRVGLLIMNLGSANLFIALNYGLTTTNGIKVGPNGGFYLTQVRDDFDLPAREWACLTDASTTAVYILELIQDIKMPIEQSETGRA